MSHAKCKITHCHVTTVHRITHYHVTAVHRITHYHVTTVHRITHYHVTTVHRITHYHVTASTQNYLSCDTVHYHVTSTTHRYNDLGYSLLVYCSLNICPSFRRRGEPTSEGCLHCWLWCSLDDSLKWYCYFFESTVFPTHNSPPNPILFLPAPSAYIEVC